MDVVCALQKAIAAKFPIIRDVKIKELTRSTDCVGYCHFEGAKPIMIQVRTKNILPDHIAVTFAHECAHAITPVSSEPHCTEFYKNYAAVLRYLEDIDVLVLKATTAGSRFNTKNLIKLDRHSSIGSNLHLGYLKLPCLDKK